jgi:hypothetical protein
MSHPPNGPLVVTHRIPRIEVYQVTDDELCRIEEGYGQVNQDLTFAVASATFFVSFLLAMIGGSIPDRLFPAVLALTAITAVVAAYTGIRWLRVRKQAPAVMTAIRKRRVEPQDIDPLS